MPTASGQQAGQQAEQDPMPVFRAGVELVVFNVAVLDEDGQPVPDLTVDDFRVTQEGLGQDISLFASPDGSALDIALVLDASGSIRQNAPGVREDAMAFVSALGERDCVYFVPFREAIGEPVWAAPDDPLLGARIGGLELQGGTALYDALVEGMRSVQRRGGVESPVVDEGGEAPYHGDNCGVPLPPPSIGGPESVRRSAVVVLSDGGDEHSVASYADALGAVWADAVPVFAVAIGGALPPQYNRVLRPGTRRARSVRRRQDIAESLSGRLEYITHISGGRLIFGEESEELGQSFDEVVSMLRSTYLLGYRPPEEANRVARGGMIWHPVDISVRDNDLEMFARPGYYERLVDTRAAENIIRESLDLVRDGSPLAALSQLNLAAQLDPGYWPTYLQRARTHLRMGDREAARDDLIAGLDLRPGTLGMHRLLADTAYALEDYELAWQQAIYAHQGGALMAPLMRALEDVADPPEDLDTQLRAVRAFVDIGASVDELDQGTLEAVVRQMRIAVRDAPDLAVTSPWNGADIGLILHVNEVEGRPRKLKGEFVLTYAPYLDWEDENIEIDDLDDPASVREGIESALEKVRRIIAELR